MYRQWILVFLAAMLPGIQNAKAQLFTGTEGMVIKSGTTFSSEGLVLQPSADLVLDNLLAQKSAVAVTSASGSSINRVYYFSRALTFGGTAGFFYQDDELNGNTAASLALFSKNQFGDNTYSTVAGGNTDVLSRYISQSFSPITFSHITAGNSNVTLPVVLTDFIAKAENNRAKISWKTLSEKNSAYYLVERSTDGRSFFPLGTLQAKGTFNGISNYVLYDESPLNGNNYYRLIQFDANGKGYNYGVRQVNFKISTGFNIIVFPNPVIANSINVKLDNYQGKTVTFTLVDLWGRILYNKTMETQENKLIYTLQLSDKPASGQYIVYVKGDNLDEKVKVVVL